MLQKKYEAPYVDVILTDQFDVIRTSGQEEGIEWPSTWEN